jgi:hypothetical protein
MTRGQWPPAARLLSAELGVEDRRESAVERVLEAVERAGGALAPACQYLDITGPTLAKLRRRHPELNRRVEELQDRLGWRRRGVPVGTTRYDPGPLVCPGCYAVEPEPCAPDCIDHQIEMEREDEELYGHGVSDEDGEDDE